MNRCGQPAMQLAALGVRLVAGRRNGVSHQITPFIFVTRKDGPVKTLQDFKGKTVTTCDFFNLGSSAKPARSHEARPTLPASAADVPRRIEAVRAILSRP